LDSLEEFTQCLRNNENKRRRNLELSRRKRNKCNFCNKSNTPIEML
jgi:hypothetical protein